MFSPNLAITALRNSSTVVSPEATSAKAATSAGLAATTASATACAKPLKLSSLATKSVSQLISTNAPTWPLIELTTMPSAAVRPANLPAFAPDLMRKISSALSKSPSASTNAFLHSIMPKPVAARKSPTIFAVIVAIVYSLNKCSFCSGRLKQIGRPEFQKRGESRPFFRCIATYYYSAALASATAA